MGASDLEAEAASIGRRLGSKIPIIGCGITAAGIGYDIHEGKPPGKAIFSGVVGTAGAIMAGVLRGVRSLISADQRLISGRLNSPPPAFSSLSGVICPVFGTLSPLNAGAATVHPAGELAADWCGRLPALMCIPGSRARDE